MTRKWVVRVIAILMALLMALSVLYVVIGSLRAQAAVTQSQIDSLKKQQQEYEKKKQELKAQIDSLQYQQSTTLQKKGLLDDQIDLTQQQIDNINEQIIQYDELIAQKTVDVQNAQLAEDLQWQRYKDNMRTMEENGAITYLSVIFRANSFPDLLSRISDMSEILRFEQDLYDMLEASKQATISAKEDLETAKSGQEAVKLEMEVKRADLQTQIDEADALLKQLEDDLNSVQELYEQEKKEAAAIQAEINKKVAELQKQQAVSGTGSFVWPVPSCNIVTSKFGMRYHPISKSYAMHYGVDIGGSYGVSIIAADGGTVITSKYSSSYGNYIVISHGNGKTTLYAHMSSRLVKEGATVTQGQTIGKLGSTGASTGPHLHFEVTVNGSRVDPLKYFSNYTVQ